MTVHDEKLLILYKYLQHNEYSRCEVAEELEITSRQLTRLIKQWQEEGLINYTGGVGRGNLSTVTFNLNVEQQFVMNILTNIDAYSVEEITNILQLPLNESSKNLIKSLFSNAISDNEIDISQKTMTLDYIYRIPETIDPLQPMDTALDTLVYNTMDRLYEVDSELNFKSHLVNHEEIEQNSITLYLFQDITFSNGKLLLAQDVKNCLDRLIKHDWYKNLLNYIQSVEVIDLFIVKITFEGQVEKLKLDLSSPFSSIYIVEQSQYIGTNVYYMERLFDKYIVLTARHTPHHSMPEVRNVYLVNSYSDYEQFIQEHNKRQITNNIRMARFTFINPYYTQLNRAERHQLLSYIKMFYSEDGDEMIQSEEVTQKPIVMGMFDLTSHILKPLYKYLKDKGFNIKYHTLCYKDILEDNTNAIPCDFVILSHTYVSKVFYYSLLNNTNIKTWFSCFEESHKFNEALTYQPAHLWSDAQSKFKYFLRNEAWILENSVQKREIVALKGQKNVVFNNDGVILYGEIIVR